jgi:hypothetical protein
MTASCMEKTIQCTGLPRPVWRRPYSVPVFICGVGARRVKWMGNTRTKLQLGAMEKKKNYRFRLSNVVVLLGMYN